jgi:hypothetical protein
MPTTLPQRMYLLGCTVEQDAVEIQHIRYRGQVLRAAALATLTLHGFLTVGHANAVRSDADPPGDRFLADVWREIPVGKSRGWVSLIQDGAATAEATVRRQLAEAGVIAVPDDATDPPLDPLDPLARHQRTIVPDPAVVTALRERVRDPILRGLNAAAVPVDDLAATVLAAEIDLGHVFSHAEHHAHKATFRAFAKDFDARVPALRTALRIAVASPCPPDGGWGGRRA